MELGNPQGVEGQALDDLMVKFDSGYMLRVHETASNILVS